MRAAAGALACLVACGGPARPAKPDPKRLAATLDADVRALGALAFRLEGKCEPLIDALGKHVATMKQHAAEVQQVLADPELGPQLKREVRAYDSAHPDLADRTGESLAKSFLACNQDPRLIQLVDQIPVME